MKQRLLNDNLARLLHNQLYQRMLSFCQQYTPEMPPEPVVTNWLNRLFLGDNNLHILVNLNDDYKIIGHAVIDVQEMYGNKVIWCYQAQGDKGNDTLNEGLEYVDKLVMQECAVCSIFMVTKHTKALERKGYKSTRTIMIKTTSDTDEAVYE